MTPDAILKFWLDELEPKDWYVANDAVDAAIRERFLPAWHEAMEGGFGLWLTYPSGTLAYLILTDQFPRNMFRGSGESFASDRIARATAKSAVALNYDLKIDAPARQFFYLPLMHSESLIDQDRAVRLFHSRMEGDGSNLLHARAHREIIRRFGRFPFRNEALGRTSTDAEREFIAAGAYGAVLRELQEAAAA
jgi:uncharacterized protein (DUF924 family)